MIVEMHRTSADSIDDAHELNRLILMKKGTNLSDEFKSDWNQAYQVYCKEREPIKLIQGENS